MTVIISWNLITMRKPILQYQRNKQFADIPISLKYSSGLILGLRPANERRRYTVTPSRIGWAQTWKSLAAS